MYYLNSAKKWLAGETQPEISDLPLADPLIQQEEKSNWHNHIQQALKAVTLVGVGVAGYLGASALFGKKTKSQNANQDEHQLSTPLKSTDNLPTKFETFNETANQFVPLSSLGTGRTLLSTSKTNNEKEVIDDLQLSYITKEQEHLQHSQHGMVSGRREIVTARTSEFQINTYTTNSQHSPSVASLGANGFVVTWASDGQDGSDWGIYGQRFNLIGSKVGSEFQVNTYAMKDQSAPSVASLGANDFVVTWYSSDQDGDNNGIYGQRFNVTGSKVGSEFQINTYTTKEQLFTSVAGLGANGFVVTWQSGQCCTTTGQDGSNYGIYGQRFNVAGSKVGSEFQINTYTTDNQNNPSVASLGANGFVVTWHSYQDGSNYGIYGQRFNVTGSKVGSEFQINTYTTNYQTSPSVANLGANSFVVTWSSSGQDGDGYGIYGRIIKFTIDLVNNDLTINEGQTVALTSSMLSATDTDSDDALLTFITSNIQRGQFEQKSNPGVAITSFMQQDIIDTNIQFIHDGGEMAPYYEISVSDSIAFTNYKAANITFVNNMNDVPIIVNNILIVHKGQAIVLNSIILNATDIDNDDATLNFTVRNVQYGRFETASNPGVAITSFTQQEIINNAIQFIHDGGEAAPSYEVKVSDGSLETSYQSASITFNPPVLVNNQLTINEGQIVVLTTSMLSAIDFNNNDTTINFTVNNVQHGYFDKTSNSGISITSFTQQEIINNAIRFVHDDSELAPSYAVKVSDGGSETSYASASITFININDQTSVLVNNQFTINESQTIVLTTSMLSATDVDTNDATLNFIANNVQHGRFEKANNQGVAITSFTQQEIINNAVQFVHDGSEIAPSYEVKVSDGELETNYASAAIIFSNVNDVPVLRNNRLIINEGQTIVLTTNMLSATDVDTNDATLNFTVNSVQHGYFDKTSNPGIAITSFTQQEISDDTIRFVHDGSEIVPSYAVKVSDGKLESNYQSAIVEFNHIQDKKNAALSIIWGIGVGVGVVTCLGITGGAVVSAIGFFGAKRWQAQKRQQHIGIEKRDNHSEVQVLELKHQQKQYAPEQKIEDVPEFGSDCILTAELIAYRRELESHSSESEFINEQKRKQQQFSHGVSN